MKTREYAVRICGGCITLQGLQCSTPECAFCRKTTEEIAELLEACQLRFVVDGEVINLHESAIVNTEIRDAIEAAERAEPEPTREQLAEALRELHDFAEVGVGGSLRYEARAAAAFKAAADLLEKMGR